MPEASGLLSQTQMPPFDIMGLLLGGRSYAGGWFSQRDRLRLAENAQNKDRSDRQAFEGGLLSSPEYQTYLKNPNDLDAQYQLWGKFFGGPEAAATIGNQLLSQGLSATQSRQLNEQQHGFRVEESLTDHQYRLSEQTHSADQQVRAALQIEQQKQAQKQAAWQYLSQPDESGLTPSQKQNMANVAADAAGYGRKDGFDVVVGPDGGLLGQVPQRGTPERLKMENTGNAISNLQSNATQSLWELQNGQVDKGTWDTRVLLAKNDLRQLTEAGAMTADDAAYYDKILVPWSDTQKPEIYSQAQDRLVTMQKLMTQHLQQFTASSLLPIQQFQADDWKIPENWKPTKAPPPQSPAAVSAANQKRLEDLRRQHAPSGTEFERGGPLPADTSAPGKALSEADKRRIEEEMKRF
jgi:hypothetical protein